MQPLFPYRSEIRDRTHSVPGAAMLRLARDDPLPVVVLGAAAGIGAWYLLRPCPPHADLRTGPTDPSTVGKGRRPDLEPQRDFIG